MEFKAAFAGVLAVLVVGLHPVQAREATVPDVSGFWELRDVLPEIPEGKLTPEGREQAAKIRRSRPLASPEVRWCRYIGVPFFYGMSPPIDIVQGKNEVVIMGETLSAPQHVYLNRKSFPDPERFETTSNGFSIGHYEGDTLVVETRGFSEVSGNPYVPGGGYKTEQMRLTQRIRTIENGRKLQITFTWVDPKVFVGPHTYTFTYFRSDPDAYAQEFYCDASDPSFGATAAEPAQN